MQPVLAHGTAGLAGEGVPVAILYVLVALGSVIVVAGLRARGTGPVGGPAVAPLTLDAGEAGPWPGDRWPGAARRAGQVAGVALLAALLVVGWAGSDLPGANPLPQALLAVGWWTVPLLSLLLGDWWRVVDPFDALAAGLDRLRGRPPAGPDGLVPADADEAGDWWVPAALLASFAWVVTCWPDGLRPRTLALWLTALTAVMVAGALLGGRRWVRRTSPYAVLCGTVAAASPVDWGHGRPRLRSPLRGLAGRAGGRRSLAVLVVLLGSTFFEAVAGTQVWVDMAGVGASTTATIWATVGLAWCILLAAGAWALVARAVEHLAAGAGSPPLAEPLAADLAATLGPLAVVAPFTHQLGALLIDLQNLAVLALDPLAEGWNLFGSYDWRVNDAVLAPGTLGWVQVGILATALALGLVAAWDRVADRTGPAAATAGWPLAAWSAGSGALALWLLLGG